MILIDETKYSCMECIRGHRSSSCRHHTRPLVQVRSKGRPNVHANGNPNHRIAVFAEEIAAEDDETVSSIKTEASATISAKSGAKTGDLDPSYTAQSPFSTYNQNNQNNKVSPKSASCKRPPVIILKASAKQVIDLVSGQIVGPYHEDPSAATSSRPPPPVISSDSFINTSTCCTPSNGISKKTKSCGCCSNKSRKNISKSTILKKYLTKHMRDDTIKKTQININGNGNGNGIHSNNGNGIHLNGNGIHSNNGNGIQSNGINSNIKFDNISSNGFIKTEPVQEILDASFPRQPLPEEKDQQVFDVVSVPSCSIPGSCACDDNCACEGCVIHGHSSTLTDDMIKLLPTYYPTENDLTNLHYNTTPNLVFNTIPTAYQQKPQIQLKSNEPQIPAQQDFNQYDAANFFAELLAEKNPNVQLSASSTSSDDTESPNSSCTCPADSCDCTNCETHGIINGYKLDDFFNSQIDSRFLSVLNEPQPNKTYRPNQPEIHPFPNFHNSTKNLEKSSSCCSGSSETITSLASPKSPALASCCKE